MCESIIKNFTKDYDEYLKDESRKAGKAHSVSFPKSEEEIIDIIRHFWKEKSKVTVQGARTGITAGAVPQEGHILNLGKMDRITGLEYKSESDGFILHVQPGVLLTDVRKAVSNKDFDAAGWSRQSLEALEKLKASAGFFFPPDPTETTASIGGMAACNASGARSFYYGPTRNYIETLRVIMSDGPRICVKRGIHRAKGYKFSLRTDTGRIIKGELPHYIMPHVKNASGYYAKPNMDLVDLFIGSEGTLGIISEIGLRLLKKPEYTWGATFFFKEEGYALEFVELLREGILPSDSPEIRPVAIEYFNTDALKLLRLQKQMSKAFSIIPDMKKEYNTAIYLEFDGSSEEDLMNSVIEAAEKAGQCTCSEEDTWIATTRQLMNQMKLFRHAVPEAVNLLVERQRKEYPHITKLGTDMAVPDEKLQEIMDMYNSGLLNQGFESVMFGHIGNNHIHINILPRTMEEYDRGKELYTKWAEKVLAAGGTVSAEHGIGKLKVSFLEMMYGQEGIKEMKAVRSVFDPHQILNRGNLF